MTVDEDLEFVVERLGSFPCFTLVLSSYLIV